MVLFFYSRQVLPGIMSNSETSGSTIKKVIETGAVWAAPPIGLTAAAHELDANGWIAAPWAQGIPGAEYSSSMGGSFVIGMGMVVVAEQIAGRLDSRGHEKAAENTRRAGKVFAWAGSIACQLAIETSSRAGVSDKWDLVAGTAATVSGIIAGRWIVDDEKVPPQDTAFTKFTA